MVDFGRMTEEQVFEIVKEGLGLLTDDDFIRAVKFSLPADNVLRDELVARLEELGGFGG